MVFIYVLYVDLFLCSHSAILETLENITAI